MIKRTVLAALLTTTLLTANAMAQDAGKIPNLVGAWESTSQMHYKTSGHVTPEGKPGKLVVASQEGQVFEGTLTWKHKIFSGKTTFSSVIENDGSTFYMASHKEGLYIGKMDGPDAFTLYILVAGGGNPRAGIASYKRVK